MQEIREVQQSALEDGLALSYESRHRHRLHLPYSVMRCDVVWYDVIKVHHERTCSVMRCDVVWYDVIKVHHERKRGSGGRESG